MVIFKLDLGHYKLSMSDYGQPWSNVKVKILIMVTTSYPCLTMVNHGQMLKWKFWPWFVVTFSWPPLGRSNLFRTPIFASAPPPPTHKCLWMVPYGTLYLTGIATLMEKYWKIKNFNGKTNKWFWNHESRLNIHQSMWIQWHFLQKLEPKVIDP